MSKSPALESEEIKKLLCGLPLWEIANDEATMIARTWKFRDFANAMVFVNAVAVLAEEENHHPDILVEYSKVTLTLSTHSAGGLTEKDFLLATRVDQLQEGSLEQE